MSIQKPQHSTPDLHIFPDGVFASSRDIARYFGKQHMHVLEAIDNLQKTQPVSQSKVRLADESSQSKFGLADESNRAKDNQEIEGFFTRNFKEATYQDGQGKPRRMVYMTQSGFVILAMGFHGFTALLWKIRYERAFREMEAEIRRQNAKDGIIKRAERHLELFPVFENTLSTTRRSMTANAAALQLQLKGVMIPAPTSQDLVRLVKKGKLEGFKVANRWHIYEDSLCNWLTNRTHAA